MLHVLHPNVLKVGHVLHMGYAWEAEGDASGCCGRAAQTTFGDETGVGEQCPAGAGPCMDAGKRTAVAGIRPGASSAVNFFVCQTS